MFYSAKTGFETMATVESIKVIPTMGENTFIISVDTDIGSFYLTKLTEDAPEQVFSTLKQEIHDLMYPADEPDIIDGEHGYFKVRSIGDEETVEEYQAHVREALQRGISAEAERKLSSGAGLFGMYGWQ